MFSNFSSKDFAKVLLIEEMSNISLIEVARELLEIGVEARVVSDFINVQRRILSMKPKKHEDYLDILNDELLLETRKYYKKCEELKIVLVLYLVEYKSSKQNGEFMDMFRVFRILKVFKKYSERVHGGSYSFDYYEELLREGI